MAAVVAPAVAPAGLYSPDEPPPFPNRAGGPVDEVRPYSPTFKLLLTDRFDARVPTTPDADPGGKLTYRGTTHKRLDRTFPDAARVPPAEQAAVAADLVRVGRAADAVNLLTPRGRDRSPDFVALVTLAHAHAARGEWDEAVRVHVNALELADPPDRLPGYSPEQTRWAVGIERGPYRRWLKLRQQEAAKRPPPETEDVDPLFTPEGADPVRFVNGRGEYEPGRVNANEMAKLPADAIAVVQQMLLWSPDDTKLLWLLGELYAAAGRLRDADGVFDQCTWGRGFTNRKRLMDHRAAVRAAVAALPPEKPDDAAVVSLPAADPPADPAKPADEPQPAGLLPTGPTLAVVLGTFGLAAAGLLALQVRAVLRRRSARSL